MDQRIKARLEALKTAPEWAEYRDFMEKGDLMFGGDRQKRASEIRMAVSRNRRQNRSAD